MLIQTGMQAPTHYPAFLATGALDSTRVISYYHSGAWFIAWRCIYAEIVGSRIEDRAIDTEKAWRVELQRSAAKPPQRTRLPTDKALFK